MEPDLGSVPSQDAINKRCRKLRLQAIIAGIAVDWLGIVVWMLGGSHSGWTQTQVPHERVDAVTGLTVTEFTPGFVPGIDFLVLTSFLGGAILVGGLIYARRCQTQDPIIR